MTTSEKYRTSDFKFGCMHGKRDAQKANSEAHIQRVLYQCSTLRFSTDKGGENKIRLIGYEIPLLYDKPRGKCVDLLGYDKELNLYLIELKKSKSTEHYSDIFAQIEDYRQILTKIKPFLEDEFEKTFYVSIKFRSIIPILLAPKEFYERKNKGNTLSNDIKCYYITSNDIGMFDPNKSKDSTVIYEVKHTIQ